jgi:TIR domain
VNVSAPIFISYSSKDQDIAETICRALEARGHACWIAGRDVHPGENFQEAIVRSLRSAKVMLLVFTSNANNSDEIKKELVLAGRHHVTVVPVRVEDVVPNDAFTYEFATRQWIDLFKNWEQEIERLATRIGHILQNAKPEDGAAAAAAASIAPRPAVRKPSSSQPLIWGVAAVAVVILIAGEVLYMRPSAPVTAPAVSQAAAPAPLTPASPQQTAAQTLPPAPAPPQQAAAPTPPSAPVPAPQVATLPSALASQPNPDEAAWQAANGAGTRVAFAGYLKDYSAGIHMQEAQLRLADLIRTDAAASKNFDGAWQTEWTCPNLGQYPGYTFQFTGQVKDGAYHGVKGVKGEPSSMVLDGKIEPDGQAGFSGEIIVGSSLVGLGAARGTPSDFHALAHFDQRSGNGKRIEGRPCSLTFMKQ